MKKKKSKTYSIHYYDSDGKRRGKTFSAPTIAEARSKGEMWKMTHGESKKPSMTVSEAVEGYITIKAGVLSPATVRGYSMIVRNYLLDIADRRLNDLTQTDVQAWLSGLASRVGAKTVKNAWGLLRPALAMYGVQISGVTLPRVYRFENYCPSDADIAALIAEVRRRGDLALLRGIYLAAFIPARRSEICALTRADIKGTAVTISKAMVKDASDVWQIKPPKERDSLRTVELPDFVMKELKAAPGAPVAYNPDQLYKHFRKALKAAGVPLFRFHDLRHYGASIMMYHGISQRTIEQRGGWAPGSAVLRKVYQDIIDAEQKKEDAVINAHFSQFM